MLAIKRLPTITLVAAGVAILFGIATIASGAQALFSDQSELGAVVPFVLKFNFAAGFAYVAAGFGLLSGARWAAPLSATIAVATLLVFAAFGVHVLMGGAYEMRTVGAMALRSVVWVAIALAAWRMPSPA